MLLSIVLYDVMFFVVNLTSQNVANGVKYPKRPARIQIIYDYSDSIKATASISVHEMNSKCGVRVE